MLVVMYHYGKQFAGRRWLCFIDNNSVRDALIKGTSAVSELFDMLSLIARCMSQFHLMVWFSRIASSSNPADKPSRLALAGRVLNERHTIRAPKFLIEALLSSHSFLETMSGFASSSHMAP